MTDGSAPTLVAPLPDPQARWLTSATELMLRDKDPEAWQLKYGHGALASWEFTRTGGTDSVPAHIRGTVIHGVLERIEAEAELSRLLDETIGSLDDPDIENALGAGSAYREALELEIAKVIESPEWAAYTEGEHYRELSFVHLAGERQWRVGAFDLYRPGEPESLVVDFKTHPVKTPQEAAKVADYVASLKGSTLGAGMAKRAAYEIRALKEDLK